MKIICFSLMSILIVVEIIIYIITDIRYEKERTSIKWTEAEIEKDYNETDFKVVSDYFYIPISILFSLAILITSCPCCCCRKSCPVVKIIIFIILFICKELVVFKLIMICPDDTTKKRMDCSNIFKVTRILVIIDNNIFIILAIIYQIKIKKNKV